VTSSAAPSAPPARFVRSGPDLDALPAAADDLPAERLAFQIVGGEDRWVDADEARRLGLTLVDLSDGWAPSVFDDGVTPDGKVLSNDYRHVFVGLSNDQTDGDGQPLAPGERNFLELYGIPPTLSVLRARFLADGDRTCADVDSERLLAVDSITTWGATTEQKELAKHALLGRRLTQAREAKGLADLAALAASDKRLAKDVQAFERHEREQAALVEVEKRMACEGLLDAPRHKPGRYDAPLRLAVLAFQQKNVLIAQGDLNRATLEAMAVRPLVHDYEALRRTLLERAIAAGGFLEDGSSEVVVPAAALMKDGARLPDPGSQPATYLGDDGERHPVPDLASAALKAVLDRLEIDSPETALAFFRSHGPELFERLRIAARFLPLPPYYAPHMDLTAEIDRGDVWYDFPFDGKGNRLPQPRERFPAFTLFVRWKGERVPLVRWRTTIGGWRTEVAADGQEYLAYKISDVGPRVWRNVVAAPVWIPPASASMTGMVKEKRVNGAFIKVTNYDEVGPGYLSAYGLVAAIHVQPGRGPEGPTYFDNGIRTHGSFDYMSLRGRFSHGCHRLYNNLAVRLFSFVLQHRRHKTLGQVPLGYRRFIPLQGEIFDLRLPTRGFYYELDPVLPVETLAGRVLGVRQTPMVGYVRKPGVAYHEATGVPREPEEPETKAGGGE